MSNGLIAVAIAHDSTCKPGEEWMFHGLAKPYDVHGSLESSIDQKDKDELSKHYAKKDGTNEVEHAKLGCALVIVTAFIYLLGVPFLISSLIERIMSW